MDLKGIFANLNGQHPIQREEMQEVIHKRLKQARPGLDASIATYICTAGYF